MLRSRPAWLSAVIIAIALPIFPSGCADRAVWRATVDRSRVVRTVAYREPYRTSNELIESNPLPAPSSTTSNSQLPLLADAHKESSAPRFDPSPSIAVVSLMPRDARQEPAQFQDISLASVIQVAFSSSPVIRSLGGRLIQNPAAAKTVYDVDISANDPYFGPQAALAQFDSVLAGSLLSVNNDRVFNNAVVGGGAFQLTQDTVSANASLQRRTLSGATFNLTGLNGYNGDNRSGNLFPNYWDTQTEAGVRQPLLRGAGRQYNLIAGPNAQPGFNFSTGLVIAQMNTQIASADFEIGIQQFAHDLHEAYWALHQAYRSYDNKRQTRDLAYDTWQKVSAKASQRLEGGQIDKESQAKQKYYRYLRAVATSLGGGEGEVGVYEAERRLRHLMGLPLADVKLLRPSDAIPVAPVAYDWESLIAESMIDRIELRRQGIKVRQQQLRLVASKSYLLPQLDLIGRYRVRGFGDNLVGNGPRFSSSYQDFFSLDHQEFDFGVEWGVTAGRRQGRAAVRNASLQLYRERAILAEQQRELTAQLSEAVSRASSIYLALQSGQEELSAAEARMRSTWILYEVDKSDLFMLLDARESLLDVSERNVSDQVRYTLALVDVSHQAGRLLRDAGVSLAGNTMDCESTMMIDSAIPAPQSTFSQPAPLNDIESLPAPPPRIN